MIRPAGAREHFHGTFLKQRRDAAPLRTHVSQTQLMRSGARNHNEIHAFGQEIGPRPKAFAAKPLDSVSTYGRAELAGDDDTEAGRPGGRRLRCDKQRKVRSSNPPSAALCARELAMPAQPAVRPERQRRQTAATSCRSSASGACGPCDADFAALFGRLASTYGRESRACVPGGRCGAGTCAS